MLFRMIVNLLSLGQPASHHPHTILLHLSPDPDHTIDGRYTSYVNSWFVDSVNWNSKQTRAFDGLPGMQRARLSRQDTGEYVRRERS